MTNNIEYQRKLVEELNNNEEFAYQNASIYTVLIDLVENNGIHEVFIMLHNVATDLNKREELESKFEDAKRWIW